MVKHPMTPTYHPPKGGANTHQVAVAWTCMTCGYTTEDRDAATRHIWDNEDVDESG